MFVFVKVLCLIRFGKNLNALYYLENAFIQVSIVYKEKYKWE